MCRLYLFIHPSRDHLMSPEGISPVSVIHSFECLMTRPVYDFMLASLSFMNKSHHYSQLTLLANILPVSMTFYNKTTSQTWLCISKNFQRDIYPYFISLHNREVVKVMFESNKNTIIDKSDLLNAINSALNFAFATLILQCSSKVVGTLKGARSDCVRFFSNFRRFWYQKKAHIFLITTG